MMTVKQFLSTTVVCATLACHQAHGEINTNLFPSLGDYSDESIRLHGLAELFPGRVVFEDPKLITSTESRVATRVADLPRAIKYIRLYRLDEAKVVLTEFQAHPALILDFRFLKSEHAAVESLGNLASPNWADGLTTLGTVPAGLIGSKSDTATPPRDTPVIVLCNRETAGPFEAILYKLQQVGAIIAVGEPTAGRTGFYENATPSTWILNGEIRPDNETSLVGTGFQPRILLEVDAEENYLSYHLYEAGTTITQLLRKQDTTEREPNQDLADDSLIEPDRILQRGVDIIAALKILQQQPEL